MTTVQKAEQERDDHGRFAGSGAAAATDKAQAATAKANRTKSAADHNAAAHAHEIAAQAHSAVGNKHDAASHAQQAKDHDTHAYLALRRDGINRNMTKSLDNSDTSEGVHMSSEVAQVSTVEPGNFLFHVNIAKVDKEKREVTGIVTAEIIDKQGDIVDYEVAKKFFSDEALWPGNIREMHQPVAVGKKVSVEFDDANKVISLTSRVSKGAPETWEKVLDRTLSMYSIGGSGDRKIETTSDGKVAKRLFLKQLAEVSLVDNGANPLAKFDIVKMDGEKLIDAQPVEPEPEAITKAVEAPAVEAAKAEEAGKTAPAAVPAAPGDLSPSPVVAKAEEPAEAVRSTVLVIDRRAPLMEVVAKFVGSETAKNFPRTLEVAEAFVTRLSKLTDAETVAKGGFPEPYDIDRALTVISFLEHLMADEFWSARYAQTSDGGGAVELAQVAMLKSAIDAVMLFLMSEYNEQFTSPATAPDSAANVIPMVDLSDAAVAMAVSAVDVVKAGARHSKKDLEMVQKMHDASVTLGAACQVQKDDSDGDDGDDVDKVAKAAAVTAAQKASAIENKETPTPAPVAQAETSADVQKMTSELDAAKTRLTEQGDQITKLNSQIADILKMARPGGPVARVIPGMTAVVKGIGVEGTAAATENPSGTPDAESVVKALQHLATVPGSSEELRRQAATEIVKIQQQTGMGRVEFRQ